MKKYGIKIMVAGAILIMLAMGTLQGCSTAKITTDVTAVNNFLTKYQALIQPAVVAGVEYIAKHHPTDAANMQKVITLAEGAIGSGTLTTPGQLQTYINTQAAKLGVDPTTAAEVNSGLIIGAAALQNDIPDSAGMMTAMNTILSWFQTGLNGGTLPTN